MVRTVAPRALALLLVSACLATAQESSEEWQVVLINGSRAGHAHAVRTVREEGGRRVIETATDSKMSLARLGQSMEIETRMVLVETADGTPLRFASRTGMSAMPTETEGVIEDGKLKVRTLSGGVERNTEQPWDPTLKVGEGARLFMLEKGFAPGTKYSFPSWSFEMNRKDETSIEVVGPEAIELSGQRVEATKVAMRSKLMAGFQTTAWVDAQGNTLVTEINAMGMKIRTERATREAALGETATAEGKKPAPEVFLGSMPRSDVIVPRPRRATQLDLRLSRDEGFGGWTPPAGLQVLERGERVVRLRVAARPPATPARLPAPSTPELAGFLRATTSVQSDDPEIVRTAQGLAAGAPDMLAAAQKIAGWVHAHIASKGYGVGSASAREVFKNREGDCSEHAVLLAAMLRAAGIPAKVCGGFLYVYGAWGGHAWVSAWVGEWVDMDATIGSHPADAARLKVSETSGEGDEGPMEGMMGMLHMGGVKIEVERYALDGAAATAAAPRAVRDGRLSVPTLGLELSAPQGWTWAAAADVPPFAVAQLRNGPASVTIKYLDVPTDRAGQGLESFGEEGGRRTTIAGRNAIDAGRGVFIELGPEEVLVFELSPGDAARAAFDRLAGELAPKAAAGGREKRWF